MAIRTIGVKNNFTRIIDGILEIQNPRSRKWRKVILGNRSKTHTGYYRVHIANKEYLYHRVLWETHNGPIPKKLEIDHINGDRGDNRIENLRLATRSQNHMNRPRIKPYASSKYKGVHWRSNRNRWQADITIDGKLIYLGRAKTEEDAAIIYNKAAVKYFGKFAKLNETTSNGGSVCL